MAAFTYTALDASGRRIVGREEASADTVVEAQLRARGLWVIEVAPAASANGRRLRRGRRHRRAALMMTRSMASLLAAGLPLAHALRITRAVVRGPVTDVVGEIEAGVARGEPLHAALAAHAGLFPSLHVGLIRAGERSGDLAGAFSRLASYLERQDALRQRLLSASIYPLLLAAAGTVAIIVLLLFVLPRFVELLEGAGAALPPSTAALLAAAGAARAAWPLLLLLPAGMLGFASWCRTAERGRRIGAMLLLRIPLIAGLRRQALGGRFARLLSTLLAGGAPLLSALEDAAASIGDPIAGEEIEQIRARVREGSTLHGALAGSGAFPTLLGQLVQVGEEAGELSIFLERAAEILEAETERALQRLVTLAEPAMILGFGLVIAFVALSLLQAIYSVNAGSFR